MSLVQSCFSQSERLPLTFLSSVRKQKMLGSKEPPWSKNPRWSKDGSAALSTTLCPFSEVRKAAPVVGGNSSLLRHQQLIQAESRCLRTADA